MSSTLHHVGQGSGTARTPRTAPPSGAVAAGHHAGRAVLTLYVRLIRRGTMLLALTMAGYWALEFVSYRSAYPDGVSAQQFQLFEDNPAVRIMNGVPAALDTAGGFAIWDAGWIIQLLLGVWAILVTTRFLRGEEELGRTDHVLAAPVRPAQVMATVLVVVATASLLLGATVTVTMVALGEPVGGSFLLGLALAGVCTTFASVAAVTSQLVEVRRRASALAAGVLAVAYVLRMVASSSDPRLWMRWITPLGWLEELNPYGEADPRVLLPLLLVPSALAAAAMALRARRDTGGCVLAPEHGHTARLGGLGGPTAFAWRSNRSVLLGWAFGLAVYAAVMGALVTTMIDWLEQDEGYQRVLADLGLADMLTTRGFLALVGTMFGVAVALQVAWRIGAARAEEETGRLEAVLARPIARLRWLGGHVLLAVLGAVLLLAVIGTAVWAGAAAAGSADVTWADSMRCAANQFPVVVLGGGLAVATFGVLPRLTVAVPVTLMIATFVLFLMGPALGWPAWALDLSPFTHLAAVPAEPWAATSGLVMSAIGVALAAAGLAAFRHRDVIGG